ncbi:MAG: glycoside hydrolase family 31 protein, partial [Treponemataceae bacterium]
PFFSVSAHNGNLVDLVSPEGHRATISVLESDLFRVQVIPTGQEPLERTWALAPGQDDVPWEGRERSALDGFSLPEYEYAVQTGRLSLKTSRMRLEVDLNGFICVWQSLTADGWRTVAEDRPTFAYNFGQLDRKTYHYLRRSADDFYVGLGEKTGDTNRLGGRYRMVNTDAAFYSARTSDPLYKHIPFYMAKRRGQKGAVGLYYDTTGDCTFDMGRELDNYHGAYRYFSAESGALDYYVIGGEDFAGVLKSFTWLTGRPFLPPRWSLGYSGSTMSYTEAPNAQERMGDFLGLCRRHGIVCRSFHLSSGYTTINEKRCVFTWNRAKFPDPEGFARQYRENGIRLVANIKPALLLVHPDYERAAKDGLFITDAEGKPLVVPFWGGNASYLDFTNPKTVAWWKKKITDQLLAVGITSMWNDNNEFEVQQPDALINGFGKSLPAVDYRPLQTLLMCKASVEAQRKHDPDHRPYSVSRAGMAGMQRYVQTWSGDNVTSWETLKYNIKMGLGLSLSGVYNIGHDIGGFLGPAPEPELFIRWIQFGIFLPRFSIHSENLDERVTEPWMYPELTPLIRELINFRERLIPHFMDLLRQAHSDYRPILRPTFYNFPDDPACLDENDDMMLGEDLLVAAVVEPGRQDRRVYLPAATAWIDWWTGRRYEGGKSIVVPAGWERTPLFAREGALIGLNTADQVSDADRRGFAWFPPIEATTEERRVFEDDPDSRETPNGESRGFWCFGLRTTQTELCLEIGSEGKSTACFGELDLELPGWEIRPLSLTGGSAAADKNDGLRRMIRIRLN